jgi:hypothetical protein
MKKIALGLAGIGILMIGVFAFADKLGLGKGGQLGAAQLSGIEVGIALILTGIGCWRVDWAGRGDIGGRLRTIGTRLLDLSPTVWAVATFLALYVALFIFPLLFSKSTIHYFDKYIPDAWVTRIGYDVEQTVTHIEVWLTEGTSPYADGIVPYSPLTLAVFAPFVVLGYPAYYKLLSLLTVTAFIFGALLIPIWISRKKDDGDVVRNGIPQSGNLAGSHPAPQKRDFTLILLFFLTGLFSYGFQFELERGQFNVIAFACCLLAIYLFHYHEKFRTFAYLLFSLAIQFKLYPVIFIVMFIKDWRDWKGNLKRMAGLGAFNFALLFVLGYPLAIQFISKIASRQSGFVSSRTEDLSISGFVYQLTTDGFGLISPETVARLSHYAGAISTLLLLVFGVCLLSVIVHAYLKKQAGLNVYLLAICTLGALFIPAGSFDYKLPILTAPIALVLGGLPVLSSVPKKIASLVLTVMLSAFYWSTLYPFTVKSSLFAKNFPALFIILIAVTGLYFLAGEKSAGETVDV